MKNILYSLIAAALLTVGCKGTQKNEGPKLTPVAAAKPKSEVPQELQKLLPKEQLTGQNARDQARLLEETLQREGGFAQRPAMPGE